MIGDQAHGDDIQARAAARGWTPERILRDIEAVDVFDLAFIPWCRSVSEALLPGLLQIMREERGEARLRASMLLLELGEPRGTEGILASLREEALHFQILTLIRLNHRPLLADGSYAPLAVRKGALLAALEPLLVSPDDEEPLPIQRRHSLAVDVAVKLDLPGAFEQLLPLLKTGSAPVRRVLLAHLARRGEDRGALDAAADLLQEEAETRLVVRALETYAKGDDEALAQRAADILVAFVRVHAHHPGDVADTLWRAMNGIVAAQHPQRNDVMMLVLNAPVNDKRRGLALTLLDFPEEKDWLAKLIEALDDAQLRRYAAQAIAENPPAGAGAELEQALMRAAQEEDRQHVLSRIVDALVAIGAPVTSVSSEVRERLDPISAMRIHWLAERITAREAAETFVQTGIIAPLTRQQLRELDVQWNEKRSAYGTVAFLLQERMAWFDAEAGLLPPNYLDLLSDLSAIGDPAFQIKAPSQVFDEESGESEIRFHYGGRTYAFTARAHGDYYDVSSVLAALNQALADEGLGERFLCLYTGDQTVAAIFVPEEPFLQVARMLQIPLEQSL